jgi:hypothetical protein
MLERPVPAGGRGGDIPGSATVGPGWLEGGDTGQFCRVSPARLVRGIFGFCGNGAVVARRWGGGHPVGVLREQPGPVPGVRGSLSVGGAAAGGWGVRVRGLGVVVLGAWHGLAAAVCGWWLGLWVGGGLRFA